MPWGPIQPCQHFQGPQGARYNLPSEKSFTVFSTFFIFFKTKRNNHPFSGGMTIPSCFPSSPIHSWCLAPAVSHSTQGSPRSSALARFHLWAGRVGGGKTCICCWDAGSRHPPGFSWGARLMQRLSNAAKSKSNILEMRESISRRNILCWRRVNSTGAESLQLWDNKNQ